MSRPHGWDFWRSIGSPKHVCAPMVDGSELPFRMLTRNYDCELCYSPMVHSRLFSEDERYRNQYFTTCPQDRPLFVQFCANDPETLLKAARHVEDKCDAVDINFGCPQHIAKRGRYGAFLLEEPDLICSLVAILHDNLSIPVTAKIRLLPNLDDTISLARRIQEAGASVLCVHGRTKEMKKQFSGVADWDAIRAIREAVDIPVISNGNIRNKQDVDDCLAHTGCSAVMSAEGLLANPALFSGEIIDPLQLTKEYFDMCRLYRVQDKLVKSHVFWQLNPPGILARNVDLRSKLHTMATQEEMFELVEELCRRAENNTEQTEDNSKAENASSDEEGTPITLFD